PFLIDPPPPPPEAVAVVERAWRDAQLAATDGVVSRHRDELEEGINTSLTAEQYAELQVYRRLLRNWPEGAEFPLVDHRPVAPPWLASPLQ
ncbi:phage tail protein, partial [Pseudomonas sp. TH03]